MSTLYEIELFHENNKMCGKILRQEREKRKISKEDLASGLMSKTALGNLETGQSGWTKITGDILLHRMGVATDYFEMVASAEELDRWRHREEICLAIFEQQETARQKLKKYREGYETKAPVEEQFILKAEVLLMLLDRKNGQKADKRQLLALAEKAIDCTVAGGWGRRLASFGSCEEELAGSCSCGERAVGSCGCEERFASSCNCGEKLVGSYGCGKKFTGCSKFSAISEREFYRLWLAPVELEAFLLMAAVLAVCGRREEAGNLQRMVWNYPKAHQWTERMEVLIIPQAAILAMELARGMQTSFACGKEALELLRHYSSHCYVLLLLDRLCMIPAWNSESEEYLKQAVVFRDTFRQIYKWFHYPACRLWQGISVDNTREAGTVLRMLRKFDGKSCAEASKDEEGSIVTARQLEKIERGDHKPSYANYQRLVRQYGILGTWNIAMLETDSVEVLEQRQRISTLISVGDWSKAQLEIEWFRKRVNETYPRVRQELLFWDALRQERKNELEKSLAMMLEALYCTVPDAMGRSMEGRLSMKKEVSVEEEIFREKNLKWWVFQREEIIIASNIASIYRSMGRVKEAKEWFETVLYSLKEQSKRTGIMHVGYEILMDHYDNLFGDMECFEEALEINEEAILNYLKWPQLSCIASAFYRVAWNAMEMEKRLSMGKNFVKTESSHNDMQKKYKNFFCASRVLANYTYDHELISFLKVREQVYLS